MEPFLIGLLIAIPFIYVLLVGGGSILKRRRRATPLKTESVTPPIDDKTA
uniref:Uncharacterized protein n=1 Tax=viral metagenome TaxID=1070528 RepID=A0A6C0DRW1_9ZZZZ